MAPGPRGGVRRLIGVWGPVWAAMVLIFAASGMSSLPSPARALDDGLSHGLGYGCLAALLLRALASARWEAVTGRTAVLTVVLATLYGATDELHQWFVPGRTAQWSDLLADAAGAAVVCGAAWMWRARALRRGADSEAEGTS